MSISMPPQGPQMREQMIRINYSREATQTLAQLGNKNAQEFLRVDHELSTAKIQLIMFAADDEERRVQVYDMVTKLKAEGASERDAVIKTARRLIDSGGE